MFANKLDPTALPRSPLMHCKHAHESCVPLNSNTSADQLYNTPENTPKSRFHLLEFMPTLISLSHPVAFSNAAKWGGLGAFLGKLINDRLAEAVPPAEPPPPPGGGGGGGPPLIPLGKGGGGGGPPDGAIKGGGKGGLPWVGLDPGGVLFREEPPPWEGDFGEAPWGLGDTPYFGEALADFDWLPDLEWRDEVEEGGILEVTDWSLVELPEDAPAEPASFCLARLGIWKVVSSLLPPSSLFTSSIRSFSRWARSASLDDEEDLKIKEQSLLFEVC